MTKRALLVLAVLIGGLGFGLWVWFSQSQTIKEIRDVADNVNLDAELGVDLSLQGIELTQGEAGKTQWRLTARKAKYLQEEGRVLVEEPEVVYYLQDGEVLTVTAPEGEVSQESQQAELWPRVKGRFAENEITAERLSWSGGNSTITLSGKVVVDNPHLRFNGSILQFNLHENVLEARKGVQVVLKKSAQIPQKGAKP